MAKWKWLLTLFAAVGLILTLSLAAVAQTYPDRPIRLVVPFTPGGSNDVIARIVGEKLGDVLGQRVFIDNRPGAGGVIGSEFVAKSSPDGYTLLMGAVSTLAANPSVYSNLRFNVVKDFTPIMQVAQGPFLLATAAALPVHSVKDLIEFAKKNSGQVNYGSSGIGSSLHLTAEMFKSMAHIDVVHIPYKGLSPAVVDLLGGRIQFLFSDMAALKPYVPDRVRALAVSSAKRFQPLADIPTIAESGVPGFDALSWYGILGPAGMPKEIVTKLNQTLGRIMADPSMKDRFETLGVETVSGTPEEFGAFVKSELTKWQAVAKNANVKVQ